ncbi:MAG TPA: 3-carboxy-cis,cis-muconate cycloisomerase [Xanthobacteraceae bacterium]|nr:3-carboxy-cis,cis-muconate cycloisomerase [Xanthobacteraceae bacterium]
MSALSSAASPLLGPLFASAKMRAALDDARLLQRMLDVEAALAHAEATAKVIPQSAASPIAVACNARHFDLAALGEAAGRAGNVAIPLVKALTAEVTKKNASAARFVHWGATSQDIIDTASVLALRDARKLLDADLTKAVRGFVALAKKHRNTPMAGRTWLQQALPTTVGAKAGGYAAALARVRTSLLDAIDRALVLQFGGAAGTLASLKGKGPAVAKALGKRLDLKVPEAPWHAHNDRLTAVAAALGIAIGTCGKIAGDVALLMQTEVGEVFEPAASGRGGSSTMPQKRNPALSAQVLAAAQLAPGFVSAMLAGLVQEHERSTGGWQASWLALPQLLLLASGAFERIAEIATGLEVDKARMAANLELTKGQVLTEAVQMALGEKMGRAQAHEMLSAAAKRTAKNGKPLKDELLSIPEVANALPRKQLDALFVAGKYLGEAARFAEASASAALKSLKK